MATFAIGDLQGCHDELMDLLDQISFDPGRDRLWFTGDLVNRGPQSLACLRFVKGLGERAIAVLGNHDLHLLAIGNGQTQYLQEGDTLDEVLGAGDCGELLDWLRRLPLVHHDRQSGFTLLHAGLPPQWALDRALGYAGEVEKALRGADYRAFLANMYGNEPSAWRGALRGWARLRYITNCFSRLRFCDAHGRLYLQDKGPPGGQPEAALPWFEVATRKSRNGKILFGHWASLRYDPRREGRDYRRFKVYPLDRGCVWGGELAALRLEDERYFSVPAVKPDHP